MYLKYCLQIFWYKIAIKVSLYNFRKWKWKIEFHMKLLTLKKHWEIKKGERDKGKKKESCLYHIRSKWCFIYPYAFQSLIHLILINLVLLPLVILTFSAICKTEKLKPRWPVEKKHVISKKWLFLQDCIFKYILMCLRPTVDKKDWS